LELKKRLEMFNYNIGLFFDMICFCPHHPDANDINYRIRCGCRKPKPGMLIEARNKLNIDMTKSFMVGDRLSDIIAGKLAGATTIQVCTGKENDPLIVTDLNIDEEIYPDHLIEDLRGITNIPGLLTNI
jgi:histidinol-phosphate phosphatase family protein